MNEEADETREGDSGINKQAGDCLGHLGPRPPGDPGHCTEHILGLQPGGQGFVQDTAFGYSVERLCSLLPGHHWMKALCILGGSCVGGRLYI